jgi:hypothetical protein
MDLGFGSSNQQIGSSAAATILRATRAQEEAIQNEISKYDSLLDANDTELEALREKRLAQMKSAKEQQSQWRHAGHGTYADLEGGGGGGQHSGDVARAFFDAAKSSPRLVVHFHRPTTRSCDAFHRALSALAPRHLETRFVKVNVEGCDDARGGGSGAGAKYLVEKLGIVVMPTLLVVLDRRAAHHVRGFDELGGREDFTANELACVLAGHGALTRREDEEVAPGAGSGGAGGISRGTSSSSSMRGETTSSLRTMYHGGMRGPRSGGYDDFDE